MNDWRTRFLSLYQLILYQTLSNFEQFEQFEQLAQTKIRGNAQNLLKLLVACPLINNIVLIWTILCVKKYGYTFWIFAIFWDPPQMCQKVWKYFLDFHNFLGPTPNVSKSMDILFGFWGKMTHPPLIYVPYFLDEHPPLQFEI